MISLTMLACVITWNLSHSSFLFPFEIPGTRKAAALRMSSDGFHNLHSEARVPGQSACSSEHLQLHYNSESEPQTSTRGKRGLLQRSQPSSPLMLSCFC